MPDGLYFFDIAMFVQQFEARFPKTPQNGAVRLSQIQLRTAKRFRKWSGNADDADNADFRRYKSHSQFSILNS